MARAEKDIADLGPIGIIYEAGRLFTTYAKPFFLIQLTLVLPSTILAVAMDFAISKSKIFPESPPSGSGHAFRLSVSTSVGEFSFGNCTSMVPPLQLLGMTFFSALVNQACQSFWIPTILYTMGLIYAGKTVSFLEVLHEIPRLWNRLVVSTLFARILGLMYCIAFLNAGLDLLLLRVFDLGPYWILIPAVVITLGAIYSGIIIPFTLAVIYGGIIIPVAQDMIVLKENYFWGPLKRGLQGKTWVPIGVLILSYVPASIPLILRLVLHTRFSNDLWSSTPLLLVAIYVISMSLVSQLTSLGGGVLFVSFEAFKMESPLDSRTFNHLNKEGYQRVRTEIESGDVSITNMNASDTYLEFAS